MSGCWLPCLLRKLVRRPNALTAALNSGRRIAYGGDGLVCCADAAATQSANQGKSRCSAVEGLNRSGTLLRYRGTVSVDTNSKANREQSTGLGGSMFLFSVYSAGMQPWPEARVNSVKRSCWRLHWRCQYESNGDQHGLEPHQQWQTGWATATGRSRHK